MHHSFMAEAKKATKEVLKTIGYNIVDYTSNKEQYPLIRFGYCYESRYPNKTQKMKNVNLTIDVWSDKRGSSEVMQISNSIESLLENYKNMANDKYIIVGVTIGDIDILEEEMKINGSNKNTLLFHGILPIQILIMEVIQNG